MSCCGENLDSSQEIYIRKDGKIAFIANQSMGGNRLTNVGDAQNDGDAINYGQLVQAISQVQSIGETYTTAIPITLFTIVSLGSDGLLYPADSSDQSFMDKVIGITLESKVENSPIKVSQFGLIKGLSGQQTGTPYFFDSNGQLTVSAPSSGFTQVVGIAKSPTELLFDLQIPIGL